MSISYLGYLYPWGDEPGRNQANFSYSGSQWRMETAPVGSFAANAFGLHDMIGNVWEWVQDCYHASYRGAPADGSAWEGGKCEARVLRGGSWNSGPQVVRFRQPQRERAPGPGQV